eukprot:TRINITY_DN4440_c0_g2_i1.p1 TRINITY_DN4440_c0_g2~~TRINITY_DN4440_c0_g2_i1.p1  ORF type:complete len:244 (-),score=64.08 TRINITY_DN4440_c0_g2_i1:403-1134(-)
MNNSTSREEYETSLNLLFKTNKFCCKVNYHGEDFMCLMKLNNSKDGINVYITDVTTIWAKDFKFNFFKKKKKSISNDLLDWDEFFQIFVDNFVAYNLSLEDYSETDILLLLTCFIDDGKQIQIKFRLTEIEEDGEDLIQELVFDLITTIKDFSRAVKRIQFLQQKCEEQQKQIQMLNENNSYSNNDNYDNIQAYNKENLILQKKVKSHKSKYKRKNYEKQGSILNPGQRKIKKKRNPNAIGIN